MNGYDFKEAILPFSFWLSYFFSFSCDWKNNFFPLRVDPPLEVLNCPGEHTGSQNSCFPLLKLEIPALPFPCIQTACRKRTVLCCYNFCPAPELGSNPIVLMQLNTNQKHLTLKAPNKNSSRQYFHFIARLEKVGKSCCTTPGVDVGGGGGGVSKMLKFVH